VSFHNVHCGANRASRAVQAGHATVMP
jgi:hypothetical protein